MSENGEYTEVSNSDESEGEQEEEEGNFEVLSQTTWCEKICLFLGSFLALLQGASAPLIAMFTGRAVNVLTTSQPGEILSDMRGVLMRITILAIAQFLLAWGWQTALMWASANQALRWQLLFLKSVLSLDISWFDNNEPAGLAAKLEMDIAQVQIFMAMGLGFLIASIGQFVSGITIAFLHGWQLTLIVCATFPLLACTGHCLAKQIGKQIEDQTRDFHKASTVAEESLMGVRTVSAFGTERFQQQRFEEQLGRARKGGIRSGIRIGCFWGLQNFAMTCLYALTLWFGGHVLIARRMEGHTHSDVNGGDVIVVLVALITGMTGISQFSGYAPQMAKAIISAKSLKEMIRWKDREIEPDGFEDDDPPKNLLDVQSIEFRGVGFSYPSRPEKVVLNKLSFSISKGQKVAFVGESGCGKSTTIQLLERFYDPNFGEVLVNGVPLRHLPVRTWRRMLGYVGQHPVLFATSALENIKAGDAISDEEAIEAARQAQILETLTALPERLDTFLGTGGGTLSGGQRQRVAIARALAKKPKVLLLDEATSALDNESERMVQATLDSLDETLGRALTTVSIAHCLTTIVNSDVIYVLSEGRCVEQGSHSELMARQGQYYAMASIQQAATAKRAAEALHPLSRQVTRKTHADTRSSQPAFNSGITSLSGSWLQIPELDTGDDGVTDPKRPRTLRRLFRAAREDWLMIPAAMLAVVMAAACSPVQAYFFNRALMSFYSHSLEDMLQELDTACLGLVVVGIVFGISVFIQNSLFTFLQEGISLRLRKAAFGSTIRMHMGFFDTPENQTASLLVSLERHMTRVSQIFGVNLANTLGAVLTCLACIILSFFGSWILALVLLAVLPIGFGLSTILTTAAAKVDARAELAYATASQTTTEAVTNIRTVRALRAEEHTLNIMTDSLEVVATWNRSMAVKRAFAFGFTSSMVSLIYLIGFGLSGVMISSRYFDPPKVLLTLFAVVFGVMFVSIMAMYLPDSASGVVAAKEVFRLIDQSSKIDAVEPDGEVRSLGDGSICLKEVGFYYPHRSEILVLRKMSLNIRKGQKVALVGYSGSGKSTVIQLLLRFYDPQEGLITVGGRDLKQLDVSWWRKQIGLVGQQPMLFDLTLEENVKYGCEEATHEQVVQAARVANMDYVFDGSRQWTDRVGLRGEKLSGGQRQRCAIARAVLRNPKILLLDEATSDLDSATEALVQEALQRAAKGVTSVTVAHRLSTIRGADQIFVLLDGQVVERGTYSELVSLGGHFAKLAARSL